MLLGDPVVWNETKPSWVTQFPFVLLEGKGQKVWDDILLDYVLGAFVTLLGQSVQGSSVIWGNVRPKWWWSLKSSGRYNLILAVILKSDMLVNRQLNWPEHHLTVFLHPLVESEQTEMSQNTGSGVEAHLQVDNQQQVLFLRFLVHLNIRGDGRALVMSWIWKGREGIVKSCGLRAFFVLGLFAGCWEWGKSFLALRVYDLNRWTGL